MDHSINVEKNIRSLVLNSPQNLFNQFNSLSDETNLHDDDDDDDDVDKINNCKYYDLEQVQTLKIPKNSLKMFYINACSLINKIFEDLEYFKIYKYQLQYYCNIRNKTNEKFRNY